MIESVPQAGCQRAGNTGCAALAGCSVPDSQGGRPFREIATVRRADAIEEITQESWLEGLRSTGSSGITIKDRDGMAARRSKRSTIFQTSKKSSRQRVASREVVWYNNQVSDEAVETTLG